MTTPARRQFFGVSLGLLLLGILPAIVFFGTGRYFQTLGHHTDTWRCACGAVEMMTHPRADMLGVILIALGGIWSIMLILRLTALLVRQDQHLTKLRQHQYKETQLHGIPVEHIHWSEPIAMTIGVLRPRILLSDAAERVLQGAELEAVMAHEAHHAVRRDPLWTILVGVIGSLFRAAPAVRQLIEQWTMLREVTADEAATNGYQNRFGLAGALLKMGTPATPSVAAFSPNLVRIDTLLHPERNVVTIAWKRWSLIAAVVVFGILGGIRAGTAWAAAPSQTVIRQCHEIHQMCQRLEAQTLLLFSPRAFEPYVLR